MANRYLRQFMYSPEIMPVNLMGMAIQTDLGAFASLVSNGITYTAKRMGSAGNSITIALVAGGTAGSEVVTVSSNAISVQIESGVSTRTQVKTAIDNSVAAAALISVSVVSGGTAATLSAAANLAAGDDTDFTFNGKNFSVVQSDTGVYEIQLQDVYNALLSCDMSILSASAADLMCQIQSETVSSTKLIVIRVQAGATPTNLSNGQALLIDIKLRNSRQ